MAHVALGSLFVAEGEAGGTPLLVGGGAIGVDGDGTVEMADGFGGLLLRHEHLALEQQSVFGVGRHLHQMVGVFSRSFYVAHAKKNLPPLKVRGGEVGIEHEGLRVHCHGVHQVVAATGGAGVEKHHFCIVLVDEHGLFAGGSHGVVVFHHVGYLGHGGEDVDVVGLCLGENVELLDGLLVLPGLGVCLRQVVVHLKVVFQLQCLREAIDGVVGMAGAKGLQPVGLEHVEVACGLPFLLLFGRLVGPSEQ